MLRAMNKFLRWGSLLLMGLFLVSCSSAYYATMEQFGIQKRHLLKKAVAAARDEQQAAGEQFKDALTRLKELYAFDGGKLEATYTSLKRDYDASVQASDRVKKRVREVEKISKDLFSEWDKEIGQMSSGRLRDDSRRQWRETRDRYDDLHRTLVRSEKTMEPVLVRFRDHVLYLKHNLNAQAMGSLKTEAADIQQEISRLITEMNRSVAEANAFIKSLPEEPR